MKNLIKKLVSTAVLSVVLLPASFAQASTVLINEDLRDSGSSTTLSDSSAELLRNVADATSVDFSVDVDVETYTSSMNQPVKAHFDLDGVSSTAQNSRFDFAASTTDENGTLNEGNGSLILTQDSVYFSQNGNDWYVSSQAGVIDYPTAAETEETVAHMQSYLQAMFHRGVVTYRYETAELINAKAAIRYAYTINTDNLVDYLVEKKILTSSKEDAARAYLSEHVTMSGSFWVNVASALPAKFTLNVNTQSGTSYTNFDVSVLFTSFNAPVNIALPTNAVDIKNYHMSSANEATVESLSNAASAMDTDGDGLTNEKEETVWNTDPFDTDTDNDGYSDYTEIVHNYNPNGVGKFDSDADGLTNSEEQHTWKTNPLNPDTDGDGYADYTEVVNGYNPNGSGKLDTDSDGLTDYAELTIHWTSPRYADSDFDGYPDGVEIANGYNPNGTGRW